METLEGGLFVHNLRYDALKPLLNQRLVSSLDSSIYDIAICNHGTVNLLLLFISKKFVQGPAEELYGL